MRDGHAWALTNGIEGYPCAHPDHCKAGPHSSTVSGAQICGTSKSRKTISPSVPFAVGRSMCAERGASRRVHRVGARGGSRCRSTAWDCCNRWRRHALPHEAVSSKPRTTSGSAEHVLRIAHGPARRRGMGPLCDGCDSKQPNHLRAHKRRKRLLRKGPTGEESTPNQRCER
jgi:hypothetical protein